MKNFLKLALIIFIVASCKNEEVEPLKEIEEERTDKAAIVAIYEANKEAFDEDLDEELDTSKSLEELLIDLGLSETANQYKIEEGRLTSLTFFDLGLHTIPNEIAYLTELTYLGFYANQLTSIPDAIGALVNLEYLHLDDTYQLSHISPEVGKLEKLVELAMFNSAMESLPKELGELKQLRWLYLEGNPNIKCLPQEIWDLQHTANALIIFFGGTPIAGEGDVDCAN